LQSLHNANTIPIHSSLIAPPPKEYFIVSNPQPTFDCTLAAAVALTAMITSLATGTPIAPMRVPTAHLKDVKYTFAATELFHAIHEYLMSSLCGLSKPNILPALRVPMKRNGCSTSTGI